MKKRDLFIYASDINC